MPNLTVGGELDGLTRVTRIMEAYYHQVYGGSDYKTVVVLVEGMTHMQFASGDPPLLVKERDLKPEISYEQAHSIVANITAE